MWILSRSYLYLWLVVPFLLTPLGCHAFTTTWVLNQKIPLQQETLKDHTCPLFPKETKIPNFPEPISEEETDLNILEGYYRDVATAYRAWAEEQEQKAQKAKNALHHVQNQLYWQSVRAFSQNDTHPYRSLNQARIHSIQYIKQTLIPASFEANACLQKANFYENLADTCTDLAKEVVEID